MTEMTHVTIRIANLHCRNTEDVTGADEFYTVSALSTGHPSQTQADVLPKLSINDKEIRQPNYVIYDGWVDKGSSVRGGLIAYDEDFAKDWAKRPQWVDQLTYTIAQGLQKSGDARLVPAGIILQYGYKAFDLIASADKDDKLGSIELNINADGPQNESRFWPFWRKDRTGFSNWSYSVDLEIVRKGPAPSQTTVDLTRLSPSARWAGARLTDPSGNSRDDEVLPFNGNDGDARGFVRLGPLTLEDGQQATALWTHPMWVEQGTIKGWHPEVELPSGARFEALVGFRGGARHTDGVRFLVFEHHDEPDGRGVWNPVVDVHKGYSGSLLPVHADLSHLAGRRVGIELRVDAGPSSDQDWAVWVGPRIVGG